MSQSLYWALDSSYVTHLHPKTLLHLQKLDLNLRPLSDASTMFFQLLNVIV